MPDDPIDIPPVDIPPVEDEADEAGLLDRARDFPVGTRDPNIIGDAGPTDVPPGSDPLAADNADVGQP